MRDSFFGIMKLAKKGVRKMVYCAMPRYMANRYWAEYGKTYMHSRMSDSYRMMYDDLAERVNRESPVNVLEYGCGYGHLLRRIYETGSADAAARLYGMDFSVSQIDNAKKYFGKGDFFIGDLVGRLDRFKDTEIDIVIGVGALMYIHPKFIQSALDELRRICRRKIFVVEYYYKYLSKDKQKIYDGMRFMDGRYEFDYEPLLAAAGFKNVKAEEFRSFTDRSINVMNEMPQMLISGEK